MMQIQIEHTEDFKALGLTPMEHLFLFRGYISEDYYDYISYFYSGFISENDRKLMLEIKLNQKPAYDRQIEHIENFMHKLPGYVYNTDSILNLQVIDWLAGEINERKRLEMVVRRMRGSRQNLKVLAAINSENWQYRDLISQIFLNNYWRGLFFLKHKDWENEDEHRLFIMDYDGKFSIDGCIKYIVLGRKIFLNEARIKKIMDRVVEPTSACYRKFIPHSFATTCYNRDGYITFGIAGKIIKVVESNLSDERYADYLRWLKEEQGYC